MSYECHHFFGESSKFNLNIENAKRKSENIFRFWDNCIRKCYNKLPLLRRNYLLSAVNGITNSRKTLCITQRDSFNLNCFHRDDPIRPRCCRLALNSVLVGLPCYLSNGPLKRTFLDIYLTTFLGVHQLKNTFKQWGSSFFWKCSKLNLNLQNAKNNWENIFRFWDNWI